MVNKKLTSGRVHKSDNSGHREKLKSEDVNISEGVLGALSMVEKI